MNDRVYGKGGVLKRVGSTEVEHDADGNLIKKTLADGAVWQYRWDAHGRLSSVSRPDGKDVTFSYDAFGRRLSKTFDGRTTEYIWDGNDLVHERVREGDAPSVLTTWVFEPGTFAPLAKIEGRKRFGVVSDHLGTPTVLTTEAGALAWKAQLDIYGVPREEAAGVAEADRTENPWRFPGQYEDAETGLYYNRFRYYDPALGRYLSEDPIGLAGGAALFGYVVEPLAWSDPLGLAAETCTRKFSKRLRNKRSHIQNQIAAGGNRGILGTLIEKEAHSLGEDFVGPGFRESLIDGRTRLLQSSDGLRQFRGPAAKTGRNPVTGEPWSRTGKQVNFQSRDVPEGQVAKQRSRGSRVAQLHVGEFSSPDAPNLWGWQPDDLTDVYFLLEFVIGPTEGGGDLFSVVVCTPEALRKRATSQIAIVDRGVLVVSSYDWPGIQRHIESIVERHAHLGWADLPARLQRYFFWEYEAS